MLIKTTTNATSTLRRDGAPNSSASGTDSMSNSVSGIKPDELNISGPSIATPISSPSVSRPISNALTIEDLLLIFQEDLRNLQTQGIRITMSQRDNNALQLTLYKVVYDPERRSLVLLGVGNRADEA